VAAKSEPSPITALRDMLATAFAADIAAVTPMVCEVLRDGLLDLATHSDPAAARSGMSILAHSAGALPLEIAQTFRTRFDAKLNRNLVPNAGKTHLGLALMDESQLQYELALDQCTARLKEQASTEMFQLTARMATMLGKPALDDAENPVVPRMFVGTLAAALGAIGLQPGECFAVFKGFRPPLLSIAPDLFNHANVLLEQLGVSAEFTPVVNRQPAARTVAQPFAQTVLTDEKALSVILDRLLSGRAASSAGASYPMVAL
jgi:hypothetical protein